MAKVKKRIMIVDDEKYVGMTFKMILENYGFHIDSYTDPASALEQFKPNLYDLTILDIRMPEIDGFVLYDRLKSKDPNVKTLFITALSHLRSHDTQESSKQHYAIKGQRHFLQKPVSNKLLLEEVYSMVS